jgi:hypothetical protein
MLVDRGLLDFDLECLCSFKRGFGVGRAVEAMESFYRSLTLIFELLLLFFSSFSCTSSAHNSQRDISIESSLPVPPLEFFFPSLFSLVEGTALEAMGLSKSSVLSIEAASTGSVIMLLAKLLSYCK